MRRSCLIGLTAMLMSGQVPAAPSTNVAWTPETLAFVGDGDAERGKALASSCAACHDAEGPGAMPNVPSLAGQLSTYLYRQMVDFKEGRRQDPMMAAIAAGMDTQAMADVAAWYASLPPPEPRVALTDRPLAEGLVVDGDGKRLIPPCRVCHGSAGQGEAVDTPALSAQQAEYLKKTLLDYKSGARRNDIYARMRFIAEQLTTEEIDDLAEFYSRLSR